MARKADAADPALRSPELGRDDLQRSVKPLAFFPEAEDDAVLAADSSGGQQHT